MNKYSFLLGFLIFSFLTIFSQESLDSIQKIGEVIIESQRIAVPYQKKSHTISLLNSVDIANTNATSTSELLQYVVGVDIRTRGVEGMQSDLYIRGGNFNQVLLLIDGVKVADLQSGHHTANGLIAIENIERIEIIKGATSRIYGQNAMNGAINIITKTTKSNKGKVKITAGSFENIGIMMGYQKLIDKGSIQFQINKQQASGYRYNTDFNNLSLFLKSDWNNYNLIASFGQRAFGANGFYASPKYKEQYEETQTNLIALKSQYKISNLLIKPSIYWRQNQDMYLFIRNNPLLYRNKHINNKVGVKVNTSFLSKIGSTGIGLDFNTGNLRSNNLGDRTRNTYSLFFEHRFELFSNKFDFTPGINMVNYSDFGLHAYPGFDMGFKLSNKTKLFGSFGYTHRIPTYTNLYYTSPAEDGNPALKPEKALTYEAGITILDKNWNLNAVYFNRNSTDLIDWVKTNPEDKWMAQNIGEVLTNGVEFSTNTSFKFVNQTQRIQFGYTYMNEMIKESDFLLSRYTLNSYKHQLTSTLHTQFLPFIKQSLSYRYVERLSGDNYHVLDFGLSAKNKLFTINLKAKNILNQEYTETNLVPMPKFNYMISLLYDF